MESDATVVQTLRLLKPAEVAEVLRVSKSMVYRLIASGEIPSVIIGHSKRIDPNDLYKYVDGSRRNTISIID